jgi:predicted branched-subunit amino acid permease
MGRLTPRPQSDVLYWVLAFVFAAISGFAHVRLNDSGLAVVFVTAFTMFLSYKRPERAWRWMLVMGLCLPLSVLAAQLTRERPPLGMVAGSFAGLAFAIVAAVGGQLLRKAVLVLFPAKDAQNAAPGDSRNS